jgi:hypothetical protein
MHDSSKILILNDGACFCKIKILRARTMGIATVKAIGKPPLKKTRIIAIKDRGIANRIQG